jgi:hypothetical protein
LKYETEGGIKSVKKCSIHGTSKNGSLILRVADNQGRRVIWQINKTGVNHKKRATKSGPFYGIQNYHS